VCAAACLLAACSPDSSSPGDGPTDAGADGDTAPPARQPFMWGFSTGAIRSHRDAYRWIEGGLEEKLQRYASDLRALSAGWLRPHVDWRTVEPVVEEPPLLPADVTDALVERYSLEDPSKNWSAADLLVDTLGAAGIDVLPVVSGGYTVNQPDLVVDGETTRLTPDLVGAEVYLGLVSLNVRACVRRYRDRVRVWQIENELNVACETVIWGWRQGALWCDRAFLTRLMKTLHDAVEAEDPEARTTQNFHTDLHWEEDVVAWADWVDIVGLDAFPNYLEPEPVQGLLVGERVTEALALGLGKPVVVLETGYPTGPAERGYDEEKQAQYVRQAATSTYEAGAAGYFHFTLVSAETGGEGVQAVEPYWGLIRSDGSHKAGWRAYEEAATSGDTSRSAPRRGP